MYMFTCICNIYMCVCVCVCVCVCKGLILLLNSIWTNIHRK